MSHIVIMWILSLLFGDLTFLRFHRTVIVSLPLLIVPKSLFPMDRFSPSQRFSPFAMSGRDHRDFASTSSHVRPPSRSSSRANGILHDGKLSSSSSSHVNDHLGLLDCLWMLATGISPKGSIQIFSCGHATL